MAQLKIVTGAGPVGWTVATQLAEAGHRVRVLTRSGSGPEHGLIERVRADASGAQDLTPLLEGADAVFHCIHGSSYSAATWQRELPKAEAAVLDAAGAAGAVVVFPESLYSYSRPESPMLEDGPRDAAGGKRGVRTQMLAARAAHATPTISVVASDFFGPQVLNAHAGERMVPAVLAGKRISVVASTSTPHSFTYISDLAAAMIKAAAMPELWNSVLHAPTGPAVTQAQLAGAFATAAGVAPPKIGAIPAWFVRAAGIFSPGIRELGETLYQFERPFVMDSARSQQLLDLAPTTLTEAALATVQWWRARA
ncbi:NAD-dependent epimerase/dehydratase family protein [Arthrobacter sp. 35W]|uniref:NAD-dependent epimerase/dehydratase family protein n=1 Tax=Arthrobacter sp. 35W TaxID=1132441 RepID=UPI000405B1B8|nr:NAD-dependent epimerase/dehydratase family protein [Arthrobacter sp. 35W]